MTLEEILPAIKQKKYVRRKGRSACIFLHNCTDGKMRLRHGFSGVNRAYTITAEDILANDWEIMNADANN